MPVDINQLFDNPLFGFGVSMLQAGGEQPGNVGFGQRFAQAALNTNQFRNDVIQRKIRKQQLDQLQEEVSLAKQERKLRDDINKILEGDAVSLPNSSGFGRLMSELQNPVPQVVAPEIRNQVTESLIPNQAQMPVDIRQQRQEIGRLMAQSNNPAIKKQGLDLLFSEPEPEKLGVLGDNRDAVALARFGRPFVRLAQHEQLAVNDELMKSQEKLARSQGIGFDAGKSVSDQSQEFLATTANVSSMIDDALARLDETPRMVGLPGAIKEQLGTVAGTVADLTRGTPLENTAKPLKEAFDQTKIQEFRTTTRMLAGQLKAIVVNEPGKHTDKEFDEVVKTMQALSAWTSETEVRAALGQAKKLTDQFRAKKQDILRHGNVMGMPSEFTSSKGVKFTIEEVIDEANAQNKSVSDILKDLRSRGVID